MTAEHGTRILGWGAASPSIQVENSQFSAFLETSDEWISDRVGIQTRYICSAAESAVSLATDAAGEALQKSKSALDDIQLLIVATETPDKSLPCAAVQVAQALDLQNALAFDVRAACTGFLVALTTAEALLHKLQLSKALVIGAEALSKIVDWNDRNTAVLFGDGAAACVIERSSEFESSCIEASYLKSYPQGSSLIQRPGSPYAHANCPFVNTEDIEETTDSPFVHMIGREVFKRGIQVMSRSIENVLEQTGYSIEDIDLFVPHQSNIRMIQSVCENFSINTSTQLATNIETRGNTSAASVPLMLYDLEEEGRLKRENVLLLTAVGSGITYGSLIVRY